MAFTVTIRRRGKVERERQPDLEEALRAIEAYGAGFERDTQAGAVGGRVIRRIEPVQQVVARLELSGRGVRGGVDVRGDGSSEAFTGRVRRRLVEQHDGESAYAALGRALR